MTLRDTAGFRLVTVCALLSIGILYPVQPVSSQARADCAGELNPQPGKWSYAPRGDRCEGLYMSPAALGTLLPVSLMIDTVPMPSDAYQLSWSPLSDPAEVHITARSFKSRVLHRMDTAVRSSPYRWPTDVLAGLGIREDELGVTATMSADVDRVKEAVYLPIRLEPSTQGASGQYVLKLASDADLSELYLTVVGPVHSGLPRKTVIAKQPLNHAYYANAKPVAISFTLKNAPPGIYHVQVGGLWRAQPPTERGSKPGGTTTTFYMHHVR